MKKTLIKWQWVYAFVAAAMFVGCQQDMAEVDLNPETSKKMDVIVTATHGSGDESRVSYTPQEETDGTTVVVKWEGKEEEMIAYSWYNADGVHFGVLPAIENSVSEDGKSQQFGGELNMNDGVNGTWHHLFYPLPWDSWITKDETEKTLAIRYPMSNQVQDCTEGNETKHLEAYNIMSVMNSQLETGSATISFAHKTSLLYMDLTLPEANTISSIKLVSEQAMFGTEYLMKFRLADAGLNYGTEDDKMSTSMTLTLLNDAEDTSVKGYLMLTPYYVDENESATFHVEATATDGTTVYKSEDITVSTTGYLFEYGKCKTLRRTLTKVVPPMGDKTADEAVKGDLAMADGTFLSQNNIATLTEEQKANVRGIVFWTEGEEGNATLTSDVIMNTDYPNCTHGLIVSLTNVSEGCMWQNPTELVENWRNNNPPYNGTDYKSILSEYGSTGNHNYILGYQNTEVLEGFNAYCDANSRSNYKVNPVSALATWKTATGNEAPANTTGWFIPSAKELYMLCQTRAVVDSLIEALDEQKLGNKNYWSSSECLYSGEYHVFTVNLTSGNLSFDRKHYSYGVRAVCAF